MEHRWRVLGAGERKCFQRFLSKWRERKELEASCERQCQWLVIEGETVTEKKVKCSLSMSPLREQRENQFFIPVDRWQPWHKTAWFCLILSEEFSATVGTVGWEWRETAVWRLAEKAIGSVHLADIKNSTHSLYLVCIHYHWAHFPAIHKMKWFNRNWVICRDVDWPRECHTEWRKSEREKQIPYINARMWNLEQWYRWTHF